MRARPSRRFWVGLGLVAAAALALRVAYVLVLERTERFGGDALFYHEQANLLARGHGFVEPYLLEITGRELPSAYHTPLYPLLLSVVSLASEATLAHQLASAGIGAATVVLVGLLGRRVGGPTVGLVAAVAAAVYPGLWMSDGLLMSETPTAFFVALVLVAAYHHLDLRTWRSSVLLGAACGLAVLTRSETGLLVPLVAVPACLLATRGHLARPSRRRLGQAALMVATAAAVLAPWVVRNLTVFEEPVLLSTNDGSTLAVANCESTYGGRLLGYWDFLCLRPPPPEEESLAQQHWRDIGLGYAGDHLDRLPVVVAARVGRVWSLYRPGQMIDFDTLLEGRDRRLAVAGLFGFYALAPLAVGGAVALRRRAVPVYPLIAPFALVTLTAAAFYGITRFRISAEVPLVVLGAAGLVGLVRLVRDRGARGPGGEDVGDYGAPGGGGRTLAPSRPEPVDLDRR